MGVQATTGVFEYRELELSRSEITSGGVLVVFQGHGPADVVGEVEACRARWGRVGVLVVQGPPGSEGQASLDGLAERVEAPWDVIQHDARLDEWRMRTDRLATQVEAMSELEELRFRATHDDLTGLLRPAEFDQRLREQFSAAERQGHELSFVLMDLDRFGAINKEFDHTVGDAVIARVAEALRAELRSEDIAGRLGGDEFAIVLPYTSAPEAARVVERVRARVAALSGIAEGHTGWLHVSTSIGFDTFPGASVTSVEGLRGHAELALRGAKRSGGDRAVAYRLLEGAAGIDADWTEQSSISTLESDAR